MNMSNDFKSLADEVVFWHKETFPDATMHDLCNKIVEEAGELVSEADYYMRFDDIYEIVFKRNNAKEEFADCILVLIAFAGRLDIDLLAAAREKFEINKQRDWSKR